jgi:hypothetical protein
MSSFLQSINKATFFVPFVKPSQLEVNKKFQVNRFSKEDSQFGKQVVVDCGDFKTSLLLPLLRNSLKRPLQLSTRS